MIVSDDPRFLKRKFEWTTSLGEIVEGQGTARITVKATKNESNAASFTLLEVTARIADRSTCDCKPQSVGIYLVPVSGPFFGKPRRSASNVINQVANVADLKFSHSTVVLGCQPGRKQREGSPIPTSPVIDVATTAMDPENDVLIYDYKVSGGVIKGKGAEVQWDLTDAPPGTYTITAGADDGCGLCGKTNTQTVTVEEAECGCLLVECPTISISGPDILESESTFTATVSGGTEDVVSFRWIVTNGEIIEGQNTPSIKAKLPRSGETSVEIKIRGLEKGGCTSSETKKFMDGRVMPYQP